MQAKERVYITDDGRLVGEGHHEAAFLLYAVGDDVAREHEKALAPKSEKPAQVKASTPQRNK